MLEFRDTDWTIQHLRVLYNAYDPGYWFFEAIECLRRLALTGFLGVLPSNVARVYAALLISFASFVLYSHCKPFRFDVADNLQTIIQAVTFVQLFFALLLIEGQIETNRKWKSWCLSLFMIGLHILVLGFGGDAIRVRGKCACLDKCVGGKAVPGDEGGKKQGDDHAVELGDQKESDAEMTPVTTANMTTEQRLIAAFKATVPAGAMTRADSMFKTKVPAMTYA